MTYVSLSGCRSGWTSGVDRWFYQPRGVVHARLFEPRFVLDEKYQYERRYATKAVEIGCSERTVRLWVAAYS